MKVLGQLQFGRTHCTVFAATPKSSCYSLWHNNIGKIKDSLEVSVMHFVRNYALHICGIGSQVVPDCHRAHCRSDYVAELHCMYLVSLRDWHKEKATPYTLLRGRRRKYCVMTDSRIASSGESRGPPRED